MPELPEIETIKLQLQKVLMGQKLLKSSFAEINNKKVMGIDRKGKMLIINFGPGFDLCFHFKMTGQLVYEVNDKSQIPNPKSQTISKSQISKFKKRIVGGHPSEDFVAKLPSKHTREIFKFKKGILYFNDMRKFGWVKINANFAEKLGPEPLEMNSSEFISIIQLSKNPVKVAIMRQELISGVGNIYANDALWEAGIAPQSRSDQLTSDQLSVLFEKIKLVLSEGIKYGGATAANYVNLHGLGGHYQDHFRVYDRKGLPCLRCQTPIKKIVLGGRGTYFCPACQS